MKKELFSVEPGQLAQIKALVRSGEYRSASEFVREAIDEKLRRIRRECLERQVASYCANGHADEDRGLAEFQAFDREDK